jgi:phosphoglycolate phosphatase
MIPDSLPPPHYAVVSFDLDGTLLDSAAEIAEAVNRALHEQGLPRQPAAELTLLIGHGARRLVQDVLARLAPMDLQVGAPAPVDAVLAGFERHYAALIGTSSVPYPGAAEALLRLRGAGVRLACVTNKQQLPAQRLLQHHGLLPLFELLIGGDTLAHKKPHASVLQHVARACGVPLQALAHVGDSATDVLAARNAGVAAWAVPWGYNGGEPIAHAAPDRLFDSLAAVASHVLGDAAADPAAPPARAQPG